MVINFKVHLTSFRISWLPGDAHRGYGFSDIYCNLPLSLSNITLLTPFAVHIISVSFNSYRMEMC